MASGVAVPEVTVPKPTISFAPKSESETTTRPEDKVRDWQETKEAAYSHSYFGSVRFSGVGYIGVTLGPILTGMNLRACNVVSCTFHL